VAVAQLRSLVITSTQVSSVPCSNLFAFGVALWTCVCLAQVWAGCLLMLKVPTVQGYL
jgi:hypothetical protein